MSFENRIIGKGVEKVHNILFNPENWRIHPKYQQDALMGVLEKVGWVQEVIINKRTGHLVDGHLRVQLADKRGIEEVPVSYVDLSEDEERLILATFDPIAAMAQEDTEKLNSLMDKLEGENTELMDLMADLEHEARMDRTLEEIDFEVLPDNPMWVLITAEISAMPEVTELLDQFRDIEGVRVETAN